MLHANKAVKTYRHIHKKLVTFWKNIDGAAIMSIQHPGDTVILNDFVSFEFNHPFLEMKLPSGRSLRYYKPNLEHGSYGVGLSYMSMNERNQFVRTHTYGGKLTENLVQALARDLLTDAVTLTLQKGHQIITHIHDELIVAGHHLETISELMCVKPDWAEKLPLEVEGAETQRYKKI
jgi:DNA polymerase